MLDVHRCDCDGVIIIFKIKQPQMLSQNLVATLTRDGIPLLISQNCNEQIILQVYQIAYKYNQCSLSDGINQIKCLMLQSAKEMILKGKLNNFEVIGVYCSDIKKCPNMVQLYHCQLKGVKFVSELGFPQQYNVTTKTEDNEQCQLQDKKNKVVTIRQLLEIKDLQNIKDLTFKARILHKPPKIKEQNPFMIFKFIDNQNDEIQAISFGPIAMKFYSILQQNKQYYITNALLQCNKKKDCMEVKLIQSTNITLSNQSINEKNSNPINIQLTNKANLSIENFMSVSQINKRSINENKCNLINFRGKILQISKLKGDGVSLQVIDQHKDEIQIVLWKEIQIQLVINKVYQFHNLKVKVYNNKISLNSFYQKTFISPSTIEIEGSKNIPNKSNSKSLSNEVKFIQQQQEANNQIITIGQLKAINLKDSSTKYPIVVGYLNIPTKYIEENHFFLIKCQICGGKFIQKKLLICQKCSSPNLIIKLNIKAQLIDDEDQIKCIINQELGQSLFGWRSGLAFKKFIQNKQQFLDKVYNLKFTEKVFKIKANVTNQGKIYYNLLRQYLNNPKDSYLKAKQKYKRLIQYSP